MLVRMLVGACVALLALSCATIHGPAEGDVVTPDGVRLRYRVVGDARPVVVLLHGGPGSNYNAVWPDLTRLATQFTVIMYDQRGGGRSQLITESWRLTADDHVRDLEAVRKHFRLEQMTIVGESMGLRISAALCQLSSRAGEAGRISRTDATDEEDDGSTLRSSQ